MALVKRRPRMEMTPFGDLARMRREMDRLFDFTMGRLPLERGPFEGEWLPDVDVYEDENSVFVKAELPGMTEKDIEVNMRDNNLFIRGEKKKEEERKEQNFYRLERTYGAFQRTIDLPTTVDAEKVKATFKNGVLEIELPKKEEAKPKQIKVEVE